MALDSDNLSRAIKVAAVVGIILNVINNPELFNTHSFQQLHTGRVLLTFFVPFCVSLYSSVLANAKKIR
ncbi:MAG: hypothetical protein CVT92_14685 [Bacteroidetes bacterium HGW-Bacteroidetes-1]|nr:MAG: hypothetical protein CVT92_14685 [Bacteroidetes bacterium HGW-Bacteroidetes-1]